MMEAAVHHCRRIVPIFLIAFSLLFPILPAEDEEKCDYSEFEEMDKNAVHVCDSKIYCSGRIIQALNYHLYDTFLQKDSKSFVDSPMIEDAESVLKKFKDEFGDEPVEKMDPEKLRIFYFKNFMPADDTSVALEHCTKIADYREQPELLKGIEDDIMRDWALQLNKRWKKLCRSVKPNTADQKRNSIIQVSHPFIVPGGRFREMYYWDSYWTIKGLLASGMNETANGMVLNFVELVKEFGFVPNGGRIYYKKRSQPPLLISMAYEYYSHTRDKEFLKTVLPALEKELQFWEVERKVEFNKDGKAYTMYQYRTNSTVPRPESFCVDVMTGMKAKKEGRNVRQVWQDLASAAESGWDFSSRWMENPDEPKLSQIITTQIVPVDLNAYICGNYEKLANLYHQIGEKNKALEYHEKYQRFRDDFQKVFFIDDIDNPKKTGWYDYNHKSNKNNIHFYASMAVPLFTRCYETIDVKLPMRIFETMKEFKAFEKTGNEFYGVPTSMQNSGEQWDKPNIWPPLMHMIVEGFRRSYDKNLQAHALDLAKKWIFANFKVHKKQCKNPMWEKLSTDGKKGEGGEYDVQDGFGWTNGAILDLLVTYKDKIKWEGEVPKSSCDTNKVLN